MVRVCTQFCTGTGFAFVVNWTSLLVNGIINFLIPLYIYIAMKRLTASKHLDDDGGDSAVPAARRHRRATVTSALLQRDDFDGSPSILATNDGSIQGEACDVAAIDGTEADGSDQVTTAVVASLALVATDHCSHDSSVGHDAMPCLSSSWFRRHVRPWLPINPVYIAWFLLTLTSELIVIVIVLNVVDLFA